jgi:hypothetical protein
MNTYVRVVYFAVCRRGCVSKAGVRFVVSLMISWEKGTLVGAPGCLGRRFHIIQDFF